MIEGAVVERTVVLGDVELPVYTSIPAELEGDDSLLAAEHEYDDTTIARLFAPAPPRLTPTQKRQARKLITRYCGRSIATAASKHYSQARPMTHLGKSPDLEWTADCSGHATGAFRWADKWTTFTVEDPNGLGYSGFGYTGTLLSRNFDHRIPNGRTYYVGDMGLYGPASATKHVVTCFKGGTAAAAVWASHGSEAGPYAVTLHYRPDFLCVVRARSLL